MAGRELIDAYLADLASRLPRDVVDELADGLTETWQHHQQAGLEPTTAAQAAIAEFGSVDQVIGAFVSLAPGRRLSRLLLASGPLVGACWGLSLVAGRAWTWPVRFPVAVGYFLLLFAVVAALVAAATSRHSLRRTRLGEVGACALIALDVSMVAATLHLATMIIWPTAIAILASLTRITLILTQMSRSVAAG